MISGLTLPPLLVALLVLLALNLMRALGSATRRPVRDAPVRRAPGGGSASPDQSSSSRKIAA